MTPRVFELQGQGQELVALDLSYMVLTPSIPFEKPSPIVVTYILPYIPLFKEVRLWLHPVPARLPRVRASRLTIGIEEDLSVPGPSLYPYRVKGSGFRV